MKQNIRDLINIFTELGKVKITLFVAISGSVGYILSKGSIDFGLFISAIGVFILSVGSAAMNHIQEIKTDSLMNRTKNRPLPSNKLNKSDAQLFAYICIITGMSVLGSNFGLITFLLGISAIISYNLIYTPLKKFSAFAIFPGSLVGAIPPVIGWAAAGGSVADPKLFALALFFFIWQIPHFWFLLLIFDNDYKQAGFPTPSKYFTETQLKRITYVWVVALSAACMMIPYFGITHNLITNLLLLAAGFILVWRTRTLVTIFDKKINFKLAFLDINFYVLIVVFLLSLDQFFY